GVLDRPVPVDEHRLEDLVEELIDLRVRPVVPRHLVDERLNVERERERAVPAQASHQTSGFSEVSTITRMRSIRTPRMADTLIWKLFASADANVNRFESRRPADVASSVSSVHDIAVFATSPVPSRPNSLMTWTVKLLVASVTPTSNLVK